MSRLFSARVKNGVIVADDDIELPEGAIVTVAMNDETGNDVELSPEELGELDAAISEADREEGIPFADVLAELDRRRSARRSARTQTK